MKIILAIIAIIIFFSILGSSSNNNSSTATAYEYTDTYDTSDLDSVDYPQEENNYDSPVTFHGDPCTEDCSGHEAGYEWAEENGITDPYECDGNSQSFIEGCESYAEEYQNEYEDESSDYYDY